MLAAAGSEIVAFACGAPFSASGTTGASATAVPAVAGACIRAATAWFIWGPGSGEALASAAAGVFTACREAAQALTHSKSSSTATSSARVCLSAMAADTFDCVSRS